MNNVPVGEQTIVTNPKTGAKLTGAVTYRQKTDRPLEPVRLSVAGFGLAVGHGQSAPSNHRDKATIRVPVSDRRWR